MLQLLDQEFVVRLQLQSVSDGNGRFPDSPQGRKRQSQVDLSRQQTRLDLHRPAKGPDRLFHLSVAANVAPRLVWAVAISGASAMARRERSDGRSGRPRRVLLKPQIIVGAGEIGLKTDSFLKSLSGLPSQILPGQGQAQVVVGIGKIRVQA